MIEHVLRSTRGTLDVIFSQGYADADVVTVTIKGGDGTVLVDAAAATKDAAVTGRYFYNLAPQAAVNFLTIAWSAAFGGVAQSLTTYADVVGSHLFAVSEARTFGDKELNNVTLYPESSIRSKRAEIVDFFEQVCDVSFVPRYARDVLDGNGRGAIRLLHQRPVKLLSASIDGATVAVGDFFVYGNAFLKRDGGFPGGDQNVIFEYEHGWTYPPAAIKRAALTLARYELVNSDMSDRMVAFTNDLGSVRLSVPGGKFPTGIPVVDSALTNYDERPYVA